VRFKKNYFVYEPPKTSKLNTSIEEVQGKTIRWIPERAERGTLVYILLKFGLY
jgi:hypothetical protein